MKIKYLLLLPFTTTLWANIPQSKTLELYQNASFLSLKFNVSSGEFYTKIPDFANLKNLTIQTNCTIKDSKITPLNESLSKNAKELKSLELEREKLTQKLSAIKAKNELLKSISLDTNSLKNIEKDTKAFGEVFLKNLQENSKIEEKIKKIDAKIEHLQTIQRKKDDKKISLSLKCDSPSSLKIAFPLYDLKYENITKFNANINAKNISITQSIFLTHTLGNLLENVQIRLFTFAYNKSLEPNRFYPHYLDMPQTRKYSEDMVVGAAAPMMKSKSVRTNGIQKNLSTKRTWVTKTLNLAPAKENEVVFDTQKIDGKFNNYIDGYGTSQAYLKGEFTPKNYILSGEARFMLDGALMGGRYINELFENQKTHLYFGKNSFIQVKKELSEKMTDKSFFNTSKNTKTLWKYTISNLGDKEEDITLLERLPISQNSSIEVKRLGKIKPKDITKDGEVSWNFMLKSKGKTTIDFGYEIEKPTK